MKTSLLVVVACQSSIRAGCLPDWFVVRSAIRFNLKTLERVEVVVGPSSFFQRANTLAATVNIITKKVDGAELSIGNGTDTRYSASAVTGKQWSADRFVTASFTVERSSKYNKKSQTSSTYGQMLQLSIRRLSCSLRVAEQ